MAQSKNPKSPSEWIEDEVPSKLPIIPLVSSVLFPGGVLSLQVGIDRNVRLLKSLPDEQNLIAAFCQKSGDKENPRPEDLSQIGVLAAIVQRLLLETVHPVERLEMLVEWIQRDLGKATFDKELQRQIQSSIDRRERENYLREQLRVIQDELGDSNAADREADTYRDRVEVLPIAEEHKQTLRREVNRLSQLSPSSSDYSVIKGHLDTIFQIPWSEKTEDRLDLQKAEEMLDQRHHGLQK